MTRTAIYEKARAYAKEHWLLSDMDVEDIKDYRTLKRAAQEVESRSSGSHTRHMYKLLLMHEGAK